VKSNQENAMADAATLAEVKEVLVTTLGLDDRADGLQPSTELLGGLPEFDSMAVVEVIVAIEQRFGLQIDETDLTSDIFETVGSLADFVDSQRA
jgi:acyl carrier protein